MTFKAQVNTVNIVLVLALLAALLVPVVGFAAAQTVAFNELLEPGSAENAHRAGTEPVAATEPMAIACSCGDPGGTGGSCC